MSRGPYQVCLQILSRSLWAERCLAKGCFPYAVVRFCLCDHAMRTCPADVLRAPGTPGGVFSVGLAQGLWSYWRQGSESRNPLLFPERRCIFALHDRRLCARPERLLGTTPVDVASACAATKYSRTAQSPTRLASHLVSVREGHLLTPMRGPSPKQSPGTRVLCGDEEAASLRNARNNKQPRVWDRPCPKDFS